MAFSQFYANAAKRLVITSLATLMVTLAAPLSAADFGAGMRAYENGDFESAYKEWLPLANSGNAEAQYWIGELYESGKGVETNYELAFSYHLKAAFQGHGEAQSDAGSWVSRRDDSATESEKALAFSLSMRAAVNGVTSAYVTISSAYCFGKGVDENPELADIWMALALWPFADRLDVMESAVCDIFGKNDEAYLRDIYRRAALLKEAYNLKTDPPPDWLE